MSPEAQAWDRQHERSVHHNEVVEGRFVPKDRPCDWCGLPVPRGYIHRECLKQEASAWLDILD